MRTFIICGALVAFAVTASAAEDNRSAKDLLPGCNEYDLSYCMGQITGIAHMLTRANSYLVYRPYECADFPQNITNREFVQALIRYDRAYPNRLRTSFAEFVVDALMDTWPCKPAYPEQGQRR